MRVADDEEAAGLPLGRVLPGWTPRSAPQPVTLAGRTCAVVPLDPAAHADDLFAAYGADATGRLWTYLRSGPFPDLASFRHWAESVAHAPDPLMFAIVDRASGRALGTAALMRADADNGVVELGHLVFSPALQHTTPATEALALLLAHVFEHLGYRRCEWKCNTLNAASRRAAVRLGFTYEGTFRQAWVVKGRNRDTAWYSIVDGEWPAIRQAHRHWLAEENFDVHGRQAVSLSTLTRGLGPGERKASPGDPGN